jgi:hypothetical protein
MVQRKSVNNFLETMTVKIVTVTERNELMEIQQTILPPQLSLLLSKLKRQLCTKLIRF